MRSTAAIASALICFGLVPALGVAQEPADADPAVEEPAVPAAAAWDDFGAKLLDVALLRPMGAISTVLGFGFFVASVPLMAPARGLGESWASFVGAPFDNTFDRQLGKI